MEPLYFLLVSEERLPGFSLDQWFVLQCHIVVMLSFPSRAKLNFGNLFRMPVGGKRILLLARNEIPTNVLPLPTPVNHYSPLSNSRSLIHKLLPGFSQLALARISAAIESPF
jgi:hypothetical protein